MPDLANEQHRSKSRVPALPELALGACLIGLAVFTALVADGDKITGEREPSTWWEWSIVTYLVVGIALGMIAAFIPALRASRLNMVTSMRAN